MEYGDKVIMVRVFLQRWKLLVCGILQIHH